MAPRFIDPTDTAAILGRSRSWLYARKRQLEKLGFPQPHPLIGRYDRALVEKWVDGQSFLSTPSTLGNPFDEAF